MLEKYATPVIGLLLLAAVLSGCVGNVQPVATQPPVEPTLLPKPDHTAIPSSEPGGSKASPPDISPNPPADQPVVSPPDSEHLESEPAPWQPQPEDQSLQRGQAFVQQADIQVMESFPPQFSLSLRGTLPTPCHQLRVELAPPDDQKVIQVSVYSVVDPNVICVQVLAPLEAVVRLQGLATGQYTVVVNGKEAGSLEVP